MRPAARDPLGCRPVGSAMLVSVQVIRDGAQVADLLYRGVSLHYPDGTAKLAWSPEGEVSTTCEIRSGNVPGKVVQDIYRHITQTIPHGHAGPTSGGPRTDSRGLTVASSRTRPATTPGRAPSAADAPRLSPRPCTSPTRRRSTAAVSGVSGTPAPARR